MQLPEYSLQDSEAFCVLIDLTRQYGNESLVDDLRLTLFYLNAPSNLILFLYLCEYRLYPILRLRYRWGTRKHPLKLYLAPMIRWIKWYLNHKKKFEGISVLRPLSNRTQYRNNVNPLSGWGLRVYGMYAALFDLPEEAESRHGWRLLALILLLAQAKVAKKYFCCSDYETFIPDKLGFFTSPHTIYTASLSLRHLSLSRNDSFLISINYIRFPEKILPVLTDYLELEANKDLDLYYCRFIGKAFGELKWVSHNVGSRSGHGNRGDNRPSEYVDLDEGVQLLDPVSDDEVQPDGQRTGVILPHPPLESITDDELLHEGIDPAELLDGDSLALVRTDCELNAKDVMSRVSSARYSEHHHRMRHQLLPFSIQYLTLGEATDLLRYLLETCQKMEALNLPTRQEVDRWEMTLLALVMLITGSRLHRAIELKISKQDAQSSKAGLFLVPQGSDREQYQWGFHAYEPTYRGSDPISDDLIRKKRNHFFFLPDLLGIADRVMAYHQRPNREEYSGEENPKAHHIFLDGDRSDYQKSIRAFLKNVPKSISDRLSHTKLSAFLQHRIIVETGDSTLAAMISGEDHELAGTRIFYTLLSITYLKHHYQKVMQPLMDAVGIISDPLNAYKTDYVPFQNELIYVGARNGLKFSVFHKAIKRLRRKLKQSMKKQGDAMITYHNLYTAYTVLMFNLYTAGRSNKSPLIPPKAIDPVTGYSTYRDKDMETPYHARLIWIPKLLQKQLHSYQHHINAIRAIILTHRPTLMDKKGGAEKSAYGEFGFFLTKKWKIKSISPKTYQNTLKPYLNAPANVHRGFIRTELIENGCPIEVVDALLGHWFSGEEPWSELSTLNMYDYQEQLEIYLQQMVAWFDIKPCCSQLVIGE